MGFASLAPPTAARRQFFRRHIKIPTPDATTDEPLPAAPAEPRLSWAGNTFGALRERNFRLFYIGLGVSFTGAWMRRTALGWVVFEKTNSYELLGTVFAVALLPLFLFAPFAGSLADRMDKRRLIIASRMLACATSSLLAIIVFFNVAPIWLIFLLAFMGGVAFAFEVPTRQSFVVELVGRDRLRNAIALNSALINLTRAIGPVIAGFGIGIIGADVVFAADALSSVVVISTMASLRLKKRVIPPPVGGRLRQLADGWREAGANLPVRNMLILLAFVTAFAWSFDTLMPAIAQKHLSLSAEQFGVLMGSFGLGAIVGALYIAGRPTTDHALRQAYGGIAVMLLGLFLMTIFRSFYGMIPCLIVAGAGGIAFLSTANSTIQMSVDDNIRGRIMGIWSLVFGGAMPLGAWMTGFAASWLSPFLTIQICLLVCLLAMGAVHMANRESA